MRTKKILIAYQDDDSIRSLTALLRSLGYKTDKAGGVSDLIRKIRHDHVQVMLLNDEVEDVKACDLVPLVRKVNPKVQIIVISSEESISLLKRLRGAGIFYQAMKPVDLDEIRSAVECAFEKIEPENLTPGFLPFFFPKALPA